MFTRREFLKQTTQAGAVVGLLPYGYTWGAPRQSGIVVNDIHSQLNATRVHRIVKPDSIEDIQTAIHNARKRGRAISISGGRHAMGGQQFGTDTLLLDMTGMNRVLDFDANEGEIEVEAGIQWPELIGYLVTTQRGRDSPWGIIQKQTGADRLCLGGTLAANAHGRGLRMRPFIGDVKSLTLIDSKGIAQTCSRRENAELFRLAIGGYGLIGIVASVRLRLAPRRKLQRVVELIEVEDLIPAFEKRIADGFLYGDFQYSTDTSSPDFLRKGVFSCYRPVDEDTPIPEKQRKLSIEDWKELLYLAHANKSRAFESYANHYLSTNGQVYWSDTHQLSTYIDDYHQALSRRLRSTEKATEVITEIYVPRDMLSPFLKDVRKDFRENKVELIYGTIRLIEKDVESFLAWAKQAYVCVIFNLHTVHSPEALARSARSFRRLIDLGIRYGGSYFLTYHRWAARRQLQTCYPQFGEFLRLKRKYDPEERFQSDWYRHYMAMFADTLRRNLRMNTLSASGHVKS